MAEAMAAHHLAQVNVATLRAPLDGPELAGFVAQLEPLNALADQSPGFVWRLQTRTATPPHPALRRDRGMVTCRSGVASALRRFVYATLTWT